VKKIFIIVNGRAQPDPGIIALLQEHFPDLGIEIVRRAEEKAGGLWFNREGNTTLEKFIKEVRW
jgi:hypothetical protein